VAASRKQRQRWPPREKRGIPFPGQQEKGHGSPGLVTEQKSEWGAAACPHHGGAGLYMQGQGETLRHPHSA
jgi:hypothetical protein